MRQMGATLRWWERLLGAAESFLGPKREDCLWCGGLVRHRDRRLPELCARCGAEVPWIHTVVCARCGRAEACPDCARLKVSYITANRAAVRYTPFMKELLARYKYRGAEHLAPLFAEMAAYAYANLGPAPRTVLTFVPLSQRRLEERGFNQAEGMARGVAKRYRLPVVSLLVRTRHTEKQSYKSRRERLDSLHGAFALDPDGAAKLRSLAPGRLVIVDDVYTTGSTLQHCGEVIASEFPSLDICGLTWAR